jgi:hypothetical protein
MADDTEACRRFEILEFVGAELSGVNQGIRAKTVINRR